MKSKSIILDKSFDFAVEIVTMIRLIQENKKEFVLTKQLLRSGTSIGANVREAHNAESKRDFVHKMSIAQKECDETLYWLELLYNTEYIDNNNFVNISSKAKELLKILRSIILSTKQNHNFV